MKYMSVLFIFFFTCSLTAADRGSLALRAWVFPTLKTSLTQKMLNESTSQVLLSSETNTLNFQEKQKIEIEGLDQLGLKAEFKLKEINGRVLQYELLVRNLLADYSSFKPIIVNISAN